MAKLEATKLEELLNALSLREKVMLVSGASAWRTHPIERMGVPVLKVSDGPNGVRGDGGVSAASFPVGVCMASTWNLDLVDQVGRAIGEEAQSKDVQVVLGPTINIHRTPIGGRNFECYSEDPLLSGLLASAFTDGVQSQGVGACLKHYVCNDTEVERHTISIEVDERTLREIYLRPFEIAIKRSKPWTIMAAYNRINGVYACSHDVLVNQILKGEWDYQGLVISDWFAAKEAVPNALGGLDLEMPGGPGIVWGNALLAAVNGGDVAESLLDDKVRRLLRVLDWSGRFAEPQERPERALDKQAHRSLAYQAAAEGMVLLKNDGVLPFTANDVKKIAVIGSNTSDFRIMGGGSSALKPHYVSTPLDALSAKLPDASLSVSVGCLTHKYVPPPDRRLLKADEQTDAVGLRCRFLESDINSSVLFEKTIGSATVMLGGIGVPGVAQAAVLDGFYQPQEAGVYEFGVLSTGFARMYVNDELLIDNWMDTEPGDAFFTQATTERRGRLELAANVPVSLKIEYQSIPEHTFQAVRYGILPPQPADPIGDAASAAAAADIVLLMVGTNDDWETEGNDRGELELPGAQNQLIGSVLAANPNTVVVNNSGSPIAMPWVEQAPAIIQAWFAGQEFGRTLIDILFGNVNPSGKLPITFPQCLDDTPAITHYPGGGGKMEYGEGVFVGYRWYDSRDIEPLFAFGHGLSYTTFEFTELALGAFDSEEGAIVTLELTNTGQLFGMETVQVYVEPISSPVARPRRELKGFTKVALAPGARERVELTLDPPSFAHWDVERSQWLAAPGRYRVCVGNSSRNILLEDELTIEA